MDNFTLDIGDIASPSTSVLDALCTLNPPSPILTPSQLTFAWSSGDIPILLYDEGYAKDAVPSYDCLTSAESLYRDSGTFLDNSVPVDSPSSMMPCSSSQSGALESLESSSTFTSVGTFGPVRWNSTSRAGQAIRNSVASSESIGSLPRSQVVMSNSALTAGQSSQDLPLRDSFPSTRSPSKVFYHPIVFVEGKKLPLHAEADTSVVIPEPEPILHTRTDESFEESHNSLLVDLESLDRPISWISSRSWDYTRYKDFVSSQGLTTRPLQIHNPQDSHTEYAILTSASHLTEGCRETDDSYIHDSLTRSHSVTCDNDQLAVPHEQFPKGNMWLSPTGPTTHNRMDTDWLNDIYLDFLIDQEGFRAAHPLFRFSGIVRQRWSAQERSGSIDSVAQFKPVSRQIFHFHYAPFETPPILRRITVNGDDTHDYVSRQGLLSLKANGVYLLQGQELPAGGQHSDSDVVKLQWQFEYLVDDRIADSSGKVMGGEKTLTPLTFSCTPALLLPVQARKNSIIHVLKKGMAPKLHAEKFQPPVQIAPTPAKNTNTGGGTPPLSVQVSPPRTQSPSSLHRRGMTHSLRCIDTIPQSQDFANHREELKFESQESNSSVRPRRNSSAGEQIVLPVIPDCNAKWPPAYRSLEDDSNANQFTGRHIISPKKLAQLFDSPEKAETHTSICGSVNPQL